MKALTNYTGGLMILMLIAFAVFSIFGAPIAAAEPAALALMDGTHLVNGGQLMAVGLAGLTVNKENLDAIYKAVKLAFNEGRNMAQPMWDKIATLVPSNTAENQYAWLGQFPRLKEWVGDRHIKALEAHGYSIKNKKFESTIGILKDDIEDDSYGVYSPMYQDMGYAAATHPDELVFLLLAAGFATTCYDGQFFFDTDHPVGTESTGIASVSNLQAGAGSPWFLLDTRRPLKPLIFQRRRDYNLQAMTNLDDENVFMRDEFLFGVDARVNAGFGFWQQAFGSKATLDATNYKAARAAMRGFKSDEGRPLGINPNVLVVGPSNESAAEDLIMTRDLAGGGTNPLYNTVDVMVVPWLD